MVAPAGPPASIKTRHGAVATDLREGLGVDDVRREAVRARVLA